MARRRLLGDDVRTRLLDPPADELEVARLTDILLDVDAWTSFSNCFTHRRTGRACDDRAALLTCVLADGINLGLAYAAVTFLQ